MEIIIRRAPSFGPGLLLIRRKSGAGLVLLLAAAVLFPPAGSYNEQIVAENPQSGAAHATLVNTTAGMERVGQSFTSGGNYRIMAVEVNVSAVGVQSPLLVSVYADAGNRPGTSVGGVTVQAPVGAAWVSAAFSVTEVYVATGRYWVVLEPRQPNVEYRWYESVSDFKGESSRRWNSSSGQWAGGGADYSFRVIGIPEATNIAAGIRASPLLLDPGQQVLYTLYFNNTGARPATTVWVNLTLAPGLERVADTNGSAGGTFLSEGRWRFSAVANGPHSFTVTARLLTFPAPGTTLTTTAAVDFLDHLGVPGLSSSASASVRVGLRTKSLYLAGPSDALQPAAPAGTAAVVTLGNTNPTARHDWVLLPDLTRDLRLDGTTRLMLYVDGMAGATVNTTATLLWDSNGTAIASASQVLTLDAAAGPQVVALEFGVPGRTVPAGDALRLRIEKVRTDPDLEVYFNATAVPSRLFLQTSSYVLVETLQVEGPQGAGTVFATLDPLEVVARVSDPFTAAEILEVRTQVAAPDTRLLVPLTPMAIAAEDPGVPPAWREYRFAVGPFADLGAYAVQVTATESNGAAHTLGASFSVVSPAIAVEKAVNASTAAPGQRLEYTVWLNNTGNADAVAWVNDTLPANVSLAGDTAGAAGGTALGPTSWRFGAVAPGNHNFTLWADVDPGLVGGGFLENVVTLEYQDAAGRAYPPSESRAATVVDRPLLDVDKVASVAMAYRQLAFTYTIALANRGSEDAHNVTVTDTLPTGVAYAASNPNATVAGPAVNWTIPLLGVGATANLTVDVVVGSAAPAGTPLTNTVVVAYQDPGGTALPPSAASVSIPVEAALLRLAAEAAPPFAEVGQTVTYGLTVTNEGGAPAKWAWVNVTVPAEAAFRAAGAGGVYNPFTRVVTWTLGDIGGGASSSLTLDVSPAGGVADGTAVSLGALVEYTGPVGIPTGSAEASAGFTVLAPSLRLAAWLSKQGVDRGEEFVLTLFFNNTGTAPAPAAWVNVSLPAGMAILAARPGPAGANAWRATNVPVGNAEGSHSVNLTLAVTSATVREGDLLNLTATLQYSDGGGAVISASSLTVSQRVSAPRIAITVAATEADVNGTRMVVVTVTLNNTGSRVAANAWVNLSVPEGLVLFADTFPAPASARGGNASWALSEVPLGSSVYTVTLRPVAGGAGTVPVTVTVDYTDSLGQGRFTARSNTESIAVPALPAAAFPWQLLVLAGVLLALAYYFVRTRAMPNIEELFLIHRNGTLIFHIPRDEEERRDADILSGMLTAVQEFVKDAFKYGDKEMLLRKMDFGEYSILIRRGSDVFLATVVRGRDTPRLRILLEDTMHELEERFGKLLASWEGNEADGIPVRKFLVGRILATGKAPVKVYE